jgi:nucleotide-binding universal stress UspA family protein
LHVISSLPSIPITDTVLQYKGRMKQEAEKYFKEARQIASKNHIELDEKIIFGYPDYDVAYFANDKKFDLIVMGARGLSPFVELFLGSTSNATVHRSKVPVLVVK